MPAELSGPAAQSAAAHLKPTLRIPIRWRIFALLFGFGFVAYVQRESLTIAAVRMMPELQLTQMQIGWIEQAFVIGYAIFQLPGSVLGQRWGARHTLTLMGLLAFVAMAFTALAPQLLLGTALFMLLLAAQLTLGIAQAATFPVSTGMFEAWFPVPRWALVQGLQTMGLGLGAAATPPLIATVMGLVGWQRALWWTSLPALALIGVWAWYARNRPAEHRAVSASELALVAEQAGEPVSARITLRQLWQTLIDRNVLLLSLSYLCMNYVFYILSNWVFLYLVQQLQFSELASGWLATAPPLAGAAGAGAGGIISSALFRRYGGRRGLRLLPLIALPAAGLLLLLAVHAHNAYWAIAGLAACFGCVELSEGPFWAAAMTVGRSNSMVVGGLMNTGGNLGGIIGIPIVAALTGHGAWNSAFLVGAGCAFASAAAWLFIDAGRDASAGSLTQPV
jgi:ACS family glucarate transporter-like MFS transporter